MLVLKKIKGAILFIYFFLETLLRFTLLKNIFCDQLHFKKIKCYFISPLRI